MTLAQIIAYYLAGAFGIMSFLGFIGFWTHDEPKKEAAAFLLFIGFGLAAFGIAWLGGV